MRSQWVRENTSSTLHKVAVVVFGVSAFLSYYSMVFPIIGVAAFFCFTALPRLWRMLIFLAISAAVVTALPFLAPIAIILMIVFFVMRLNYIFKNWKAVLGGMLVYGSFAWMIANGSNSGYYYYQPSIFKTLFIGLIVSGLLHLYMKFLYQHGYNAAQALEIMGAVPIVLIALVLPFLKMFDFADFTLFHGSDTVHYTEGAAPTHGTTTEVPAAGVHHVNAHMRTAPDGIVENNLSYHGPGKIPNTPTVHVNSYAATNPDGIPQNNFSYTGHETMPDTQVNFASVPKPAPTEATDIVHIGTGVVVNEKDQKQKAN